MAYRNQRSPNICSDDEEEESLLEKLNPSSPDFGRVKNDLLSEICDDIGIKDSMDLDFYDVTNDTVIGQGEADDAFANIQSGEVPLDFLEGEYLSRRRSDGEPGQLFFSNQNQNGGVQSPSLRSSNEDHDDFGIGQSYPPSYSNENMNGARCHSNGRVESLTNKAGRPTVSFSAEAMLQSEQTPNLQQAEREPRSRAGSPLNTPNQPSPSSFTSPLSLGSPGAMQEELANLIERERYGRIKVHGTASNSNAMRNSPRKKANPENESHRRNPHLLQNGSFQTYGNHSYQHTTPHVNGASLRDGMSQRPHHVGHFDLENSYGNGSYSQLATEHLADNSPNYAGGYQGHQGHQGHNGYQGHNVHQGHQGHHGELDGSLVKPLPRQLRPPHDYSSPPIHPSRPPSNQNMPLSNQNRPPSNANRPPSNANIPPSNHNMPPSNATRPPSNANMPPSNQNMPSNGNMSSSHLNVPPSGLRQNYRPSSISPSDLGYISAEQEVNSIASRSQTPVEQQSLHPAPNNPTRHYEEKMYRPGVRPRSENVTPEVSPGRKLIKSEMEQTRDLIDRKLRHLDSQSPRIKIEPDMSMCDFNQVDTVSSTGPPYPNQFSSSHQFPANNSTQNLERSFLANERNSRSVRIPPVSRDELQRLVTSRELMTSRNAANSGEARSEYPNQMGFQTKEMQQHKNSSDWNSGKEVRYPAHNPLVSHVNRINDNYSNQMVPNQMTGNYGQRTADLNDLRRDQLISQKMGSRPNYGVNENKMNRSNQQLVARNSNNVNNGPMLRAVPENQQQQCYTPAGAGPMVPHHQQEYQTNSAALMKQQQQQQQQTVRGYQQPYHRGSTQNLRQPELGRPISNPPVANENSSLYQKTNRDTSISQSEYSYDWTQENAQFISQNESNVSASKQWLHPIQQQQQQQQQQQHWQQYGQQRQQNPADHQQQFQSQPTRRPLNNMTINRPGMDSRPLMGGYGQQKVPYSNHSTPIRPNLVPNPNNAMNNSRPRSVNISSVPTHVYDESMYRGQNNTSMQNYSMQGPGYNTQSTIGSAQSFNNRRMSNSNASSGMNNMSTVGMPPTPSNVGKGHQYNNQYSVSNSDQSCLSENFTDDFPTNQIPAVNVSTNQRKPFADVTNTIANHEPRQLPNDMFADAIVDPAFSKEPMTPQQSFIQNLVCNKSTAYRSHPLFPLLRDLIIADLNFNNPTFPYRLIANLPKDFTRLLQNYAQRNKMSLDYQKDAAKEAVMMDALKYAHQSLIDKIAAKSRKMDDDLTGKSGNAVEDFCERFDQSIRKSFVANDENSGYSTSMQAQKKRPDVQPPTRSRTPADVDSNQSNGRKHPILPKEAVNVMLEWLRHHRHNPYPNDEEKEDLQRRTQLTVNQINYWFTNARRRILPRWAMAEMGHVTGTRLG